MKIKVLLLLVSVCYASWDTLYMPDYNRAFLKLSTDAIIQLDYEKSIAFGEAAQSIIEPPVDDQEYSLAMANGDLYAFYQGNTSSSTMGISKLNYTDSSWKSIAISTTLRNSTNFFTDSTIMTSYDDASDKEVVYIYGGRLNDTITNRILEFNPTQGTLNMIITSVSPTAFYGGSATNLDPQGTENIIIGGRASSGWVSMFQIALWEHKSWTFTTVKEASFNVNSRTSPLVLSVFDEDEYTVGKILVLGGTLGTSQASPYVMSLNMTSGWFWKNETSVGDFSMNDCLGGVVIGNTLISVSQSGTKRDEGYSLELFDVGSFQRMEVFEYSGASSSASSSISSSESDVASTPSSQQTSSSQSAIGAKISTKKHKSKKLIIIYSVVIPVIALILAAFLSWFIYNSYFKKSMSNDARQPPSSDSESDYYKAISNFDNASISTWNQKRDEYDRQLHASSPSKSRGNTPRTPAMQQRRRSFAEPEDYEDLQELSPMSHGNKSRNSMVSSSQRTAVNDQEDSQIDEFWGQRDVQVLVSTRRRSTLRITNPDVFDTMESEVESVGTGESMETGDSVDTDETAFLHEKELGLGDKFDFDIDGMLNKLDD